MYVFVCFRLRSMNVCRGSSTKCYEELSLAIWPLEIIQLESEPLLWLETGLGLNQCPSTCHPLKVRNALIDLLVGYVFDDKIITIP